MLLRLLSLLPHLPTTIWGPWIINLSMRFRRICCLTSLGITPCHLGSSYGMRTMPLFPRQHNSPKRKRGNEGLTGRKARGLQMEEVGCNCQTFLSLLSSRRKQTNDIFFSFSIQFFLTLFNFTILYWFCHALT